MFCLVLFQHSSDLDFSHVQETDLIHDWNLSYTTETLMVLEDEFLLCCGLVTHPRSAQMTGSGLICSTSYLHVERNPAVNNSLLKKLDKIK